MKDSALVNYTPEEIRTQFALKAYALFTGFDGVAKRLEAAYNEGRIQRNVLPLTAKGALAAIETLEEFLNFQLEEKIQKAEKSKLRYRDAELQKAKEARARKNK
jgi:hypothetical protein